MDQTCFIFGHTQIPVDAAQRCLPALIRTIEQGVHRFVLWPEGPLELMVFATLQVLRSSHPEIQILCLTTDPEAPPPPGFDGTVHPDGLEEVPKRFLKTTAFQWMIRHCCHAVCCVPRKGNLMLLKTQLLRDQIPVIELCDPLPEDGQN